MSKLLAYKEVDPEYKDIYGNTPLHYACQRGSIISIISLGGKKNIDYNVKNYENNTPLAYCFLFQKENVAISLIQQNVELDQYAYPLKERNESLIISSIKNEEKQEDKKIDKSSMIIENNNNSKSSRSSRSSQSSQNNINNNLFNNNFNNPFNNKYNNPLTFNYNYGNPTYSNFNSSSLFQINPKGVQLFRLCIKNNFQGLTHLFITRGYNLMKAVEDSFNEQKFNLAIKLLNHSPYNETYQELNRDRQNLFHILVQINNIQNLPELSQFLNILYSKEISLDSKDNFGNTPLHYAAKRLFKEFIRFTINKFENNKSILDIKNNDNYTPLILSMKGNNINSINREIFDLLFTNKDINQLYEENEIKFDLNSQKTYKCSLLLFIIRNMLKRSISKTGVEIFTSPPPLLNSLNFSLESNLQYFYKKLIQNGASINQKDSNGREALIYAVLENNFPILKMLCQDGGNRIDKNLVDINGKSLVHYCVSLNNFGSYENKEMLNYLLDNNFIATSKDY